MAKKSTNLSGDIDLIWLGKGSRQRVYRDIATETENGNTGLATAKSLQGTATELTELLQNLESTTSDSFGALEHDMQVTYAAEFGLVYDADSGLYVDADTGIYYETVFAKIRADAEAIVEQFTDQYSVVMGNVDDLGTTITELTDVINGEIRRGFIDVTAGGVTTTYFGIAITSRDIFSATTRTIDDNGEEHDYYEILDTGQCFGLYTATGWQFWRGSERLGWYDTEDGMLHVADISVDNNFQMGNWKFVNNGTSFGIKYVGS